MKKNVLNFMRVFFAGLTALFLAVIFFSCNAFVEIEERDDSPWILPVGSGSATGGQDSVLVLSASQCCVVVDSLIFGDGFDEGSRSAFPSGLPSTDVKYRASIYYLDSGLKYYLKATGTPDPGAEFLFDDSSKTGTKHVFVFYPVNASKECHLTVYAYVNDSPVAEGTATFTLPAGTKNFVQSDSVKLGPSLSGGQAGSVSLKIKLPAGIRDFKIDFSGTPYQKISPDEDIAEYALEIPSVAAGTYKAVFTAADVSGKPVDFSTPVQSISVFSGLTTDRWYLNPDTAEEFLDLSDASAGGLKQIFVRGTGTSCTFYGISGRPTAAGNDANKGTIFSPLATVREAISRLPATGGTIYVDGITSDEKTDADTPLTVSCNVTIKDMNYSITGGDSSGTIKVPVKIIDGATLSLEGKACIMGNSDESLVGVNVVEGTLNLESGTLVKDFKNGGVLVDVDGTFKCDGVAVTSGADPKLDSFFSNIGSTSDTANTTPFDVLDKKYKYIRINEPALEGDCNTHKLKSGMQGIAGLGDGSTLYLGKAGAASDTEWALGGEVSLLGGTAGQTYSVMPSSTTKKAKFKRKSSAVDHAFIVTTSGVSGTRKYKNLVIDGFVGSGSSGYYANGGTHSFEGCEFYNNVNTSGAGGAIQVGASATVNLTGCTIGASGKGNSAGTNGGAISVGSNSVLNLLGTANSIRYNQAGTAGSLAVSCGGGIYLGAGAKVVMEGGSISNNMIGNPGGNIADLKGKGGNVCIYSSSATFDFKGGTISRGIFYTGTAGTGSTGDMGVNIYNGGKLRLDPSASLTVASPVGPDEKYSVYSTRKITDLDDAELELNHRVFDGFDASDGFDLLVEADGRRDMRRNKMGLMGLAKDALIFLFDGTAGGNLYVGKTSDSGKSFGSPSTTVTVDSSKGTAGKEYKVSLTNNVSSNKIEFGALTIGNNGSLLLEGVSAKGVKMSSNEGTSLTLGANSEVTGATDSGVTLSKGTFILDGGSIHHNGGTTVRGGGIHYTEGTLTLKKGSINNNTALIGGGLYTVSTTPVTLSSTDAADKVYINENTSSSSGGGVYLSGPASMVVNPNVELYIEKNVSGADGGGICLSSSTSSLTLNSGYIQKNECASTKYGGGIYAPGDITVSNVVFSGNKAFSGLASVKAGVGEDGSETGDFSRGIYANGKVSLGCLLPDSQDICLDTDGYIAPTKASAGAYICPLSTFDTSKVFVSPTNLTPSNYKVYKSGSTSYTLLSTGKIQAN